MSGPYDIVRLTQKKPLSLDDVGTRLGLSGKDVAALIKEAQGEGYTVRVRGGFVSSKAPGISPGEKVTIGSERNGRKKVAIVTDVHYGSIHTDLKGLRAFLIHAYSEGCRQVICTGDILDGVKPVLLPEQVQVGFDAQAKVAVEHIYSCPPMEWVVIGGNHDAYASDAIGMESGKVLAERMNEAGIKWHYAGSCIGHARVSGLEVQLWHPHGAGSTRNHIRRTLNARIEAMQNKVDLLAIGHFHKYATVTAWPEEVYGICGGTWQKQHSTFAQRMNNPWDVGGSIISFTVKDGRASEISTAFYPSSQKP